MRYYRKMFRAFVGIAVIYTLLIEVVFLSFYWIPSRREFTNNIENTSRQLSEFTDIRLQSPQEMGVLLNLSEYTRKYLAGNLDSFEKFKYSSFFASMHGISPAQKYASALTIYEDDYVILNNSTGNVDFFRSAFYISEQLLDQVIIRFNENKSENTQILTVEDGLGRTMYVIARCEWLGNPQPLYIFTLFYEQQLFHLDALTNGTLAVFYKNSLVASSGDLQTEQVKTVLQEEKDDPRMIFQYQHSSVPGFHYVYIVESQNIITPTLLMIIAVGLLALGASIALMTLITKRMYTPIEGVLQSTGEHFTAGDEFAYIKDTIISLHTDVETMSQSLEKQKVFLENKFLHDLLIGLIPPEEIEAGLDQFSELQVNDSLAAILLKYTETDQFAGGFSHEATYDAKQRLKLALEALFFSKRLFRIIDMNFETQVVIVHVEDLELLTERLRNTLIGVEPEYGLEISAVIGSVGEGMASIPSSYRQALKVADMQDYLTFQAKVIRSDAIKANWKEAVYYPLQVEQTLINAIIHCKTSIWQSTLEEIISTNLNERSSNLSSLCLMFGATVNRIMDGSNVNPAILFGEHKVVDLQFRSCRSYKELQQQAVEIFLALDSWFAKEQEKSNSGLAKKMLAYLHEHYKEEISLFNLADYLNLSRNYVSTLFKNATGRNFKDYLSEYRHSVACHIIEKHPNIRIKEVAELVGCSTEMLSRLFVRYSGMLPSDYQQKVNWESRE